MLITTWKHVDQFMKMLSEMRSISKNIEIKREQSGKSEEFACANVLFGDGHTGSIEGDKFPRAGLSISEVTAIGLSVLQT